MANAQNLKSLGERTTSEQREIAHKGGIASGKKRREQRDFKELYKLVCSSPLPRYMSGIAEELEQTGFKSKEQSFKLAIVLAQVKLAASGGQASTKAAEHIAKMMGEMPADKTELTGANGSPLVPEPQYNFDVLSIEEGTELVMKAIANEHRA